MRPGMYIGSTGTRGLHHLIWEIVDNAIDEAANGYASEITVTLKKDGSCVVTDNGRGIPVDIHPQLGVSAVEVVYTQLHAGGKFNDKNYAYSGGLHGVGASVVNALSEWVVVDVYQNYVHYQQRFESREDPKTGKIVSGHPVAPLARLGNTRRRGTQVAFKPDPRVFEDVHFQSDVVRRRVRELAYLNRGVRFVFTDERAKDPDKRESVVLLRGRHGRFRAVSEHRQDHHHRADSVRGEPRRTAGARGHSVHRFLHGEHLFLRQQHPHGRGRHARDRASSAALTKVDQRLCAHASAALKEKDDNLTGDDCPRGLDRRDLASK